MKKLLSFLGISLSPQDKILSDKLNNSYGSLRVIGKSTLVVDASEVNVYIREKGLYEKARVIVERG